EGRWAIAASAGHWAAGSAAGDVVFGAWGGKLHLVASNGGAMAMTITSSNIGIGTTTPGNLLAVDGNVTVDGLYAMGTTTTSSLIATSTLESRGRTYFTGLSTNVTGNGVCITSANEITNAGAAACVPSALRFKQNISPFGEAALDELAKLNVVTFEYKPELMKPGERIGLVAEDVEKVDKRLVAYDEDGQLLTINFEQLTPLLIKGMQEQQEQILPLYYGININSSLGTSTPFMFVDAAGNIGIGSSTPAYKLAVEGEVAAQGFINVSTREAKKDISFLGVSEEDEALEKIKGTKVATYLYNGEECAAGAAMGPMGPISPMAAPDGAAPGACSKRLGLIAEQAPAEILSFDGKGVDLYKMTTLLWAGVKAQQLQIENLQLQMVAISQQLAAGNIGPISQISPIGQITGAAKNLVVVAKSYIALLAEKMAGWVNAVLADNTKLEVASEDETNKTYRTYGADSTREEIMVSGTATLIRLDVDPQTGLAPIGVRVRFDESFVSVISEMEPIKVILTPTSRLGGGLYVHEKSRFGFEVREINAQDEGGTFDWLVIAKKRGSTQIETQINADQGADERGFQETQINADSNQARINADQNTTRINPSTTLGAGADQNEEQSSTLNSQPSTFNSQLPELAPVTPVEPAEVSPPLGGETSVVTEPPVPVGEPPAVAEPVVEVVPVVVETAPAEPISPIGQIGLIEEPAAEPAVEPAAAEQPAPAEGQSVQ
ncbi:MAG: tail fiber domain-containing protein, partial [Patescibacteria group bacterium]